HAKIDQGAKDVEKATINAMNEISGAIISITLVMAAVFVPVTFIPGPTGVFYQQFGVTLIVAILISAVNALTLSPALCALFLKPHDEKGNKKGFLQRFFTAFNAGFDATVNRYGRSLTFLYKHKWITVVILLIAVGGIFWTSNTTPSGFVPDEDRGIIFLNMELPPGASIDRTAEVNRLLYNKVIDLPGVNGVTTINGFSLISGAGNNFGLGFIKLDNWEE